MSEQKKLETTTRITYNDDGTCEIFVYYDPNLETELPNVILGFIAEQNGKILSTRFSENELVFIVKNFPTKVSLKIDNKGNLILFSGTGDVNKYSINEMGELEYEKEI